MKVSLWSTTSDGSGFVLLTQIGSTYTARVSPNVRETIAPTLGE